MDFLDLTIKIDSMGNITTETYQKPMNLFLYITPNSAHPPGLMKSLVFGLLNTYYIQNSKIDNFYKMIRLLFNRLQDRGHKAEDLQDLFLDAVDKIQQKYSSTVDRNLQKVNDSSIDNCLYFHIPYHPRDISRKKIRDLYEKICENEPNNLGSFKSLTNDESGKTMKIDRLTVAYHRPKILRDLLCPSALAESNSCKVSDFV